MPRIAGVEFSDTESGYLDRNRIPEDGFETYFLAAASTKAQSSFPVVDGDGRLRRGNVHQAWEQRETSGQDLEVAISRLARYFDDDPIAGDREDMPVSLRETETTVSLSTPSQMTLDVDEDLAFDAQADPELDFNQFEERVGGGFNEWGVRENFTDDGDSLESVDVIFEAMEPGPPERRNGVRITEEFLREVASKDYGRQPPHLKDHNAQDTFSRIGGVKDVWFSDSLGKLMLMTRTPNVQGSRTHQEAIARYTHNPPEIRDGSVGFGQQYEAVRNDDGEPELVDGQLREFSTVNFPGGYDDGGVKAAFAEAAQAAAEVDDPDESGENSAAFNATTTTETY